MNRRTADAGPVRARRRVEHVVGFGEHAANVTEHPGFGERTKA